MPEREAVVALRAHRELPTAPRRAYRGGEHRVAEVPADGRRAGGAHREHVSRGGARGGRDRREAADCRQQRTAGPGRSSAPTSAPSVSAAAPTPRSACRTPAGRSPAVRPVRCARGGRPRETQPAAPGSRAPPRNRGDSPGRTSRRARGARRRGFLQAPRTPPPRWPARGEHSARTSRLRPLPGPAGGGHGHRHGRDDEHHRDRDHRALARRGTGNSGLRSPRPRESSSAHETSRPPAM